MGTGLGGAADPPPRERLGAGARAKWVPAPIEGAAHRVTLLANGRES